jgi:hypothetical protein
MHALVVTLLLSGPLAGPLSAAAAEREDRDPRARAEQCLAAGAVGAFGAVVGGAVGGGIALLIGEGIRISDPAQTQASKSFESFAVPFGVLAGGLAGLAAGTIGAWEFTDDLVGKPPVTR